MFGYVKKKDFIAYQNKVNKELFKLKHPFKFSVGEKVENVYYEYGNGIITNVRVSEEVFKGMCLGFSNRYHVFFEDKNKTIECFENELKLINNK